MSVKLYRHNESGEVVAIAKVGLFANVLHDDGTLSTHICKIITDNYTALPEAPEVSSTAWAFDMASRGKTVFCEVSGNKCHLQNFGSTSGQPRFVLSKGKEIFMAINPKPFGTISSEITWKIYEEPKLIGELLPHEFVEGQEVLVRDYVRREWMKRIFIEFAGHLKTHPFRVETEIGDNGYLYCLPYAENAHLEGKITSGEHGAVPKGYVPPHVPKLGDDDYWQVGDEVVDFSLGTMHKIVKIKQKMLWFSEDQRSDFHDNGKKSDTKYKHYMRVLYHVGSYVNEDGTVHEHIPTRPHKIEE